MKKSTVDTIVFILFVCLLIYIIAPSFWYIIIFIWAIFLLNKLIEKIYNKFSNIKKNQYQEEYTNFDSMFSSKVRDNGYIDFRNGKAKDTKRINHKYTCIINDKENYNVIINFNDKEDSIKEMSCTCKEFTKNHNCKHIYSVLCYIGKYYKNTNKEDKSNVYELFDILDSMQDIIDDVEISYDDNNDIYDEIMDYTDVIDKYKNMKASLVSYDTIVEAYSDLSDLENLKDDLDNYIEEQKNKHRSHSYRRHQDNEDTEDNTYDDFNFEEEDLEEDDYYYEDDDVDRRDE